MLVTGGDGNGCPGGGSLVGAGGPGGGAPSKRPGTKVTVEHPPAPTGLNMHR